jgi:putative ABC transport system permease protein
VPADINWLNDARAGLRTIVRQPRLAAFVVLTLGVAIGATTVIFSFVNGLVLKPLPLGDPDRVVLIYSANTSQNVTRGGISLPDFLDWRTAATSFEDLAAAEATRLSLETASGPVGVRSYRVTANLFRAWGLRPVLGRTFSTGEDHPGSPPVAVLSHGFWVRQFGSDSGVVGRTVRLGGRPCTIVGVLTPDIEIGDLSLIDVWTPLPLDRTGWPRSRRTLQVTALRKRGITVRQADTELGGISGSLATAYPGTNRGWGSRVLPFSDAMAIPETWLVLALASLAVVLVLLVACANVAGLMLARGLDRRKEVAIRLALGASRGQIARPMFMEAVVLALGGGGAGLLFASAGLDVVRAVTFHPFFRQVALEPRVLAFVLALSLATPLLFGLGPALSASRLRITLALQAAGTGSVGTARGLRTRAVLVVSQVAVALALLVVCALTVRAAVKLQRVDPGFDTTHVLVVRTDLPEWNYEAPAQIVAFQEKVTANLARLPGVGNAAATDRLPVLDTAPITEMSIQGKAGEESGGPWAARVAVSPDYFATMGIALLAGRSFSPRDKGDAPGVALLSDDVSHRYWDTRERTLGARIRLGGSGEEGSWLEVVGVVGNVRSSLAEAAPRPCVYVPLAQAPERKLAFVLRAAANAAGLSAPAREAVRAVDAEQAAYDLRTLDQALYASSGTDRLVAGFFAAFALVALLLASVGLYALMSYSVGCRTGEIGMRMVLGALPVDILSMIVLQGLRLGATGVAAGVLIAYPLAEAMRGAVQDVGTSAPLLYGGVAALLLLVATVSGYLPARHAMRLDPAKALRAE